MAEKVEFEDFSGGITDYYLQAPANKVRQCDNLLISQYQNQGKIFTRPGSELFDILYPRVGTNSRINTCFYYQGTLYAQSGSKLYYYKYNADPTIQRWVLIPGQSRNTPGGEVINDAFPFANGDDYFTYSFWNFHILMANSTASLNTPNYPMKILYNDGVRYLVQAGMPKYDPDINNPESRAIFASYGTGGGKNYLYKFVFSREYVAGGALFKDIGTPSLPVSVLNFGSSGDPTRAIGSIRTDSLVVVNTFASLPPIGDPAKLYWVKDISSYYKYDSGVYLQITDMSFIKTALSYFVAFSNIQILDNTEYTNYITDGIQLKIEVYRTANNGTTYYYAGSVDNVSTGFIDYTPDTINPLKVYQSKAAMELAEPGGDSTKLYYTQFENRYWIWAAGAYIIWHNDSLDGRELLYTTGGVVENDPPPTCKTIHIRNDIAYYGNCDDLYFRLRQSVPGDIDSCPESFFVDVDDTIVAVSSTKNNVVILCKQNAYRVDGFFDELGRGGMTVERISDTAGCLNQQCVVQALDGVFWLGKDAVYYTDGFRVLKLNQDYDKSYRVFTQNDLNNLKFQGKYDKTKNRIWWTIQDPSSADINRCYVLDLNWGIRENATFTTVSGTSFVPTAIEFKDGDMIRCDQYGYVLIHKDTLYVDPKIDPTRPVTVIVGGNPVYNWLNETILYVLETCAYNFGTSSIRKYVTQANITCESTTNLALQIISNNDDNRVISNLLPVRYRNNIVWGEPDVYWRDPSLLWNRQGLIHEKRLMPAKSLRCNYKSIKFTNAKVAIINSDVLGTVNINNTFKTVTLTNTTVYDWPNKAVGYFIAFEADNYVNEYLIVDRTDDILVYQDTFNTSQTATNQKWVIRGKPQGETLNLLNFSIIYDVAGTSLNPYRTSDSGEVGV